MSDMVIDNLIKRFIVCNNPDVGYSAALPVSTSTGICDHKAKWPADEKNKR
jgi:hypothetical protein